MGGEEGVAGERAVRVPQDLQPRGALPDQRVRAQAEDAGLLRGQARDRLQVEPHRTEPDASALTHPHAGLREHARRPRVPRPHRRQAHQSAHRRLQTFQDFPR